MKKTTRWAPALALCCLMAPAAAAGNGSNYIAMINGIDYFFGLGPYSGPPGLRGIWRCFPSENLHSPTKVRDMNSPAFNTYATKVCAIHTVLTASQGFSFTFPTITLSTSPGTCHFAFGGNLNFALSAAPGGGSQLIGPLDGGGIAAIDKWTIAGLPPLASPFPPGTAILLTLNITNAFNPLGSGTISSVPVPEGHSLVLWHAEPNNQLGPNTRFYWTGSLDERNICSGYSFLLDNTPAGVQAQAFSQAWEWGTGIGTRDATLTNIVTSAGFGPLGGNSHGAAAQPFDAGSGATTVSITGTTPFAFTSTTGEILGFNTYDESNPFGGSLRLVCLNLWGFTTDGSTACLNGSNPAFVSLPTGGPGGPSFGGPIPPVGNEPRFVGQLDATALALKANPVWTLSTVYGTVPGGSNIPYFAAPAGISGSTGNTGGFVIPIPPLSSLVGIRLFAFSASLNASGTAIAKFANEGHSHSNGVAFSFFP